MQQRSRAHHVLTAVSLGVLLVIGSVVVAGPVRAGDPSPPAATPPSFLRSPAAFGISPQHDIAFGYRVGEERRYILEPEKSLRPGESAWWSIVLNQIEVAGDDVHAVFVLQHQRSELLRDMFGGIGDRLQVVDVNSRLYVNQYGFPERVVIQEQNDVSGETGSLSDLRTTTFTFDGERYVKSVRVDGREWDFNIAIASFDDLDLSVPSGMFAYLPTALRCLGVPGAPGLPVRCDGEEPAFANPGLLSLALPLMWEEQVNEKEFLFFTPTGIGTVPGGLMDMSRVLRREHDQIGNFTRYYDRKKLEVKEFVPGAEIGPRSIDAWLFDGSGEMREVWVDEQGVVLKVDIDPHPVTHAQRWIRLQFPSEY
ncbi:MAG: hypothetical protein PVJ49_15570 [Acidobacteriota bacterium]|jgi:hypothetical protein